MASGDARGRRLVVRLQFSDSFQVSESQLDSVLTDIRKDQYTSQYTCSLGSRLSSSSPPAPVQLTDSSQTEANLCRSGACGIEAIASSPIESAYSYYAKTAPRDDDDVSKYEPTILVEIFANESVNGTGQANAIINVVKLAVENNIVEKQSSDVKTKASICVLNFLAVNN